LPAVIEERHVSEAIQFGEPRIDIGGYRLQQNAVPT
jgi:hypothetical protein